MAYDCFSGNVFDIRDVMKRFEELESEGVEMDAKEDKDESDDVVEFRTIRDFLDSVKGYGGDEQWRGDWYPVTFVRDSYFKDYAQELAEDCGIVQSNPAWPNNCIDWGEAAHQLRGDYASVSVDGDEFWYH